MKNLKLNKLTKVLALFSLMVLFFSTVNVPKADATTGFPITDDNPVTVQINGSVGVFSITVSDANTRYINVSSGTPVKTQIVPVSTGYQSFSKFDSVDYRPGSMMAWHFIPGAEYTLYVYPQTSPATVTINMSKSGSNGNWVYNQGGTTYTEKNILSGGQSEFYNLANQTQGYYNVTITSNITNLGVGFSDADGQAPDNNKSVILNNGVNGSQYVFTNVKLYTTGYAQTNYGIYVSNPNSPNVGGTYTITVQKVGSF